MNGVNGVSDTQSYSLIIRDAFYDCLDGDPFFDGFNKRKTKMTVVMPNLLPYLGVYFLDETMTPDGDANAGDIRFIHTQPIGFSVIVANNDQVEAEKTIDAAYWKIMHLLWKDPYLMNMLESKSPDNTRIEGITRGTRRHVFGTSQANNETPVAELQYDVNVTFRTEWYPDITDTLDSVYVRTGVKIGETEEEMAQRKQAGTDIIFNTSREVKKERKDC